MDSLPSFIHSNINGIYSAKNKSKVNLLHDIARSRNSIFISLTESHLKPHICDAEISMENYVIFRTDRGKNRKMGGVINYIRDDLASDTTIKISISNEFYESTACPHKKS